jgi:hypothetical protein
VTFRVSGLPKAMSGWVVHGPGLGKLAKPVELFRSAFAASLKTADTTAPTRAKRVR